MRYQSLIALALVALAAGCTPPPASAPSSSSSAAKDPAANKTPQPMERVAAEAGVGKKGQKLKDETGIVVEPVKQLIAFEQKAVFDFQIKPALNLYQAQHGSYPKDYAEFDEKIIKANNLTLPELPEGHKYVFDSEKGELMVERPAQ